MTAAPFPVLRLASLLTPRLYSSSVCLALLANFGMIGSAYHIFGGTNISEGVAWTILGSTTAGCVIFGAVAFSLVATREHKRMFYRHYTWREHVAGYVWNHKTKDKLANADAERVNLPTGTVIEDRDGIRALIITWVPSVYQPVELLRNLFETKMEGWKRHAPSWLTPEFQALIRAWMTGHGYALEL